MSLKFQVEGLVSEYPVYRLLADISGSKLSGILTISGDDDTIDIHLDDGCCVRVGSHYPRDGLLLGQLMVYRGYCNQEQLDELLETQKTSLILLGRLALDAGYLSETELRRLLEDQILLAMFSSLSWKNGVYYFKQKEKVPYSLESVRPVDLKPVFRLGQKILKSWSWMRERLITDELVPTRVEGVTVVPEGVQVEHSTESETPVVLTRPQEKLWNFVDGERTIREILDSVHLFEWNGRISLIDLEDAGVISIPKKAPKKRKKVVKDSGESESSFSLPKIDFKRYTPLLAKGAAGLVVLIGLIYGMTLVPWSQVFQSTEVPETVVEYVSPKARIWTGDNADKISIAVSVYHLYTNAYPTTLSNLVDDQLIEPDVLSDGWNNEFIYEHQDGRFKLISKGPDKTAGTDDDLVISGQASDHVFGCYFPQAFSEEKIAETPTEGETS